MAKYTGIRYELPDINTVWTDKETYPYAVIFMGFSWSQTYILMLSTTPFVVTYVDIDYVVGENVQGFRCKYNSANEEHWGDSWLPLELTDDRCAHYGNDTWTSHDIYRDDGTLFLAASDPVPVPTPQDFYIVKNGVGQKQDTYKRVGGQWVKLDEYLI